MKYLEKEEQLKDFFREVCKRYFEEEREPEDIADELGIDPCVVYQILELTSRERSYS